MAGNGDGIDDTEKRSDRKADVGGKVKVVSKRISEKARKMMFTSTIDPYDIPLKWWETEYVKYALSYTPVKTRLITLMGSDVVRLSDRRYMLRLRSKTKEHLETCQKIRIEERKLTPEPKIRELLLLSQEAFFEKLHR
ncbi:hypothetical protein KM043_008961 [Ampulex compressa]|nr:hypothetical protein KM043_008961 [Ampulex compressa]